MRLKGCDDNSKDTNYSKQDLKDISEIIKVLTNVQEVEFKKIPDSKMCIKPNYKTLGKKFGSKTKDVVKLIEKMKPLEIEDKFKLGEFELEKDDLIIKQKSMEGTSFSKGYVVLDLTEDEELKEERFFRELVRGIQKARQEEKLNVLDKINLFLEDKEFIRKFENRLKEEVRAEKISYGVETKKGEIEYKDLSLRFGFEKN